MGKKRLFDEVEADETGGLEIKVNEEFAARLNHNKRREELHRLQEKLASTAAAPAGSLHKLNGGAREQQTDLEESSSSSDSDEELDLQQELQDKNFLRALARARGKEAADDETAEWSYEEPEPDDQPAAKKAKKQKQILLKDVGPHEEENDDEDPTQPGDASQPYAEELENARQSLIKAAEPVGVHNADTDLFPQPKIADSSKHQLVSGGQKQANIQGMLDKYFGKDEELTEDDLFLKRFISQPDLSEENGDGAQAGAQTWQLEDDAEDEAYLAAADRFEAEHNFRFQEPGADTVTTYPRSIDGVVRQADTKRAEARERKKQRKQEERAQLQASIQRMKTLKRQEIEDRLQEVQKYSGLDAPSKALEALLASADFDEAEYDQAMAQAFGEDYYEGGAQDDLPQPEEMEEEEASPTGAGDDLPATGSFRAKRRQLAAELSSANPSAEDTAAVQRLLDEYNKLDYEDIVAGAPTRFRYREVPDDDFGLDTADILSLSDKDLNQVVGLAKLAPYRQERNPRASHFLAKQRLRQLQNASFSEQGVPQVQEGADQLAKLEVQEQPEGQDKLAKARLATYDKPRLKVKSKKQELRLLEKSRKPTLGGESAEAPTAVREASDSLTRAQKRNLRRSRIRSSGKGVTA